MMGSLFDALKRHKKVSQLVDAKSEKIPFNKNSRFRMFLKDKSFHEFGTMKRGFEIVRGKAPTDEPRQVVLNHPDAVQRPPSTDDGPRTKANPPPGQIVTGYSPKPGGNSGFNFTYGPKAEEQSNADD